VQQRGAFATLLENPGQASSAEIRRALDEREEVAPEPGSYLLLENFGLDIALLIGDNKQTRTRFLELKAFVGSRAGGVGFGNGRGRGAQVDLLLQPDTQLEIANGAIRWLLVDWTRPPGTRRYVVFTSMQAKRAAMGQVARGKQNNLS
jgi:hypothetical protein